MMGLINKQPNSFSLALSAKWISEALWAKILGGRRHRPPTTVGDGKIEALHVHTIYE